MALKNEKTKIRILPILLLVIVMLLSLCACDDESPGIETTTAPQNTETTESSNVDTTEEMATDEFGNPVANTTGTTEPWSLDQSTTMGGTTSHNTTRASSQPNTYSTSRTQPGSSSVTTRNSGVQTTRPPVQTTRAPGNTTKATTKVTTKATTKANTYYAPKVATNSAPGKSVYKSSDGSGVVDYSNTSSGYIMVKYSGSYSNIRVIVSAPNGANPQYPITPGKGYFALPLTGGSGTYTVNIYGNNGGNSYYTVGSTSIKVSLSSSTVAFSRPNIFCNYTSSTSCVTYAANNLTRGCTNDIQKVQAIYNYVVKNFSYDYNKASSVASTAYVPNLNSVWSSKKGICFDYASTMAAMLRTQGIPTKVEVGYVNGNTYHAWISTYIKGSGWVNDIIYFNGNSWKLMDPTFASTGGINYDWSQKGSYSVKYLY